VSTITGVTADEVGGVVDEPPDTRRWSLPGWLVVGGLLAILMAPLVLALGVLHSPRWYPLTDLAMTELRVRDVLRFEHPPLIGLPGRITGYGEPGSHPGPLSFYALAPVYWLTGSTAWSLKIAVVVLDAIALGLTLWMVQRRGGAVATLGMAVALVIFLRAYGPHQLTEPWNPFMPPVWWIVLLVAAWCVLCDDLALLPLAVFAGSFCAQTHVSYVPLVSVMLALTFGWVLVDGHRRRAEPGRRRRTFLWVGGSLGLLGLLWAPPISEEISNDPGNISVIIENFRHPTSGKISFDKAWDVWLARIDPIAYLTGDPRSGSWTVVLAALLLLALWIGTVVVAWRRRADLPGAAELLRLHVIVAAALAVGLFSLTRIIGVAWFYLHLWAMGTTALLLLATCWTIAAALGHPLLLPRRPIGAAATAAVPADESTTTTSAPATATAPSPETAAAGPAGTPRHRREQRLLVGGMVAVLLIVTGMFSVDAAYIEIPAGRLTRTLRHVAPDTVAALTADDAPGGGKDGRYLVSWIDPIGIGEHGWGMLDELERAGLDVYVDTSHAVPARFHRLLEGRPPTAIVTVVGGPLIDDFRQDPRRQELAYFEPRNRAQKARFDELMAEVEDEVAAAGMDDEINLDNSLFTAGQTPGLPPVTSHKIGEMIGLGLPLAVFVEPVGPPDAAG
jgi:hypothetical protein